LCHRWLVLKARLPSSAKDDPVRWRAGLTYVRLVPMPTKCALAQGQRRKELD
jgi:hypothetical protein